MDSGLFISHLHSPRIDAHFERLCVETDGLIAWQFVLNPTGFPAPEFDRPYPEPAALLPNRHADLVANGGLQGGWLDVVLWPCLAVLDAPYSWVMEYDVDYAGSWRTLFTQYADADTDLLTTTVRPEHRSADWAHWKTAGAPDWVQPEHRLRSFNPVMRLSRELIAAYPILMADRAWAGHYEFTVPTSAAAGGFAVADLVDARPPAEGPNYWNTSDDWQLQPGTFVWRPARDYYFHERPDTFEQPAQLYHPVKPGFPAWQ